MNKKLIHKNKYYAIRIWFDTFSSCSVGFYKGRFFRHDKDIPPTELFVASDTIPCATKEYNETFAHFLIKEIYVEEKILSYSESNEVDFYFSLISDIIENEQFTTALRPDEYLENEQFITAPKPDKYLENESLVENSPFASTTSALKQSNLMDCSKYNKFGFYIFSGEPDNLKLLVTRILI